MNKTCYLILSIFFLASPAQPSLAASSHPKKATKQSKPHPITPKQWQGAYIGAHIGALLGKFTVSNPFGSSIFGDTLRTPGFLGGIQAGYNWQADQSYTVYGLEADISGMDANGSNTCFAYSGHYVSANGTADPDFSAKLTGRVGRAFGANQRSLLYIKAGFALLNNELSAVNNNLFSTLPPQRKSTTTFQWGPSVGAGVEFAISPACSLKLEYDYLHSADAHLNAPQSIRVSDNHKKILHIPTAPASVKQNMHQVMLGFNYHLTPQTENPGFLPNYWQHDAPNHGLNQNGWQLETGIRYFSSWGHFQKDLPAGGISTSLVSRLTYDDIKAHSGELFARFDHRTKIFIKAAVVAGSLSSGQLNNEDWGLPKPIVSQPVAYSNTRSNLSQSDIHHATLDIGYHFLSSDVDQVGVLIGYHVSKEKYNAIDYHQIASPDWGLPLSSDKPGISETDTWRALRLGLTAQAWLATHWRLDIDCTYLPYLSFRGEDDHWRRGLVIHEAGSGQGVQFEAIANYRITPQATIGLGARYWAMWSTDGEDIATKNGKTHKVNRLDTYRFERYGAFLQASYQLGE